MNEKFVCSITQNIDNSLFWAESYFQSKSESSKITAFIVFLFGILIILGDTVFNNMLGFVFIVWSMALFFTIIFTKKRTLKITKERYAYLYEVDDFVVDITLDEKIHIYNTHKQSEKCMDYDKIKQVKKYDDLILIVFDGEMYVPLTKDD